jgi:hypothetical protein
MLLIAAALLALGSHPLLFGSALARSLSVFPGFTASRLFAPVSAAVAVLLRIVDRSGTLPREKSQKCLENRAIPPRQAVGTRVAFNEGPTRLRFTPCSTRSELMDAMRTTTHPATVIRPGLHSLRSFPTLCEIDEAWGKIELKLETDDTRYWVTTEGMRERSRQSPANYVVDFVTVEKRTREGGWDLSAVFSPEAWKLSQAFDYCQLLYRELRTINEKLETDFSWELRRQLDSVRREIEVTNQSIRSLTDLVRAKGT